MFRAPCLVSLLAVALLPSLAHAQTAAPSKPVPARSGNASAQRASVRPVHQIPQPLAFTFAWNDSARDPFIDGGKRGVAALLANRPKLENATRPLGYSMKDFVADLRTAGDNESLKVQSVMPGAGGVPTVAVVNGQSYQEGDWIPLRVHTSDFESFAALAKSKKLEFERVSNAKGGPPTPAMPSPAAPAAPGATKGPAAQGADVVILLKMGRVDNADAFGPGGIELRVPGYNAPLVVVPIKFPPRLDASKTRPQR